MKITDFKDLAAGDIVRYWHRDNLDRWAEGPVWLDGEGCWMIGRQRLGPRGGSLGPGVGPWVTDLAKHPAERRLPTKTGAVVDILKVDGVGAAVTYPIRALRRGDAWVLDRTFGDAYSVIGDDMILEWVPLKVVPA